MDSTKDAVITQALTLSESDRLAVIERLSESLSSAADLAAAWDAEIDRRLDNVANGHAKFQPWEEARRLIAGEQDTAANQGLLDLLLSCPVKGFFVPIECESTDTL